MTNIYICRFRTGGPDLQAFYFVVDADVQYRLGQDAFQLTNALQYIFAPVGALTQPTFLL
jgi:hypothetical protein